MNEYSHFAADKREIFSTKVISNELKRKPQCKRKKTRNIKESYTKQKNRITNIRATATTKTNDERHIIYLHNLMRLMERND